MQTKDVHIPSNLILPSYQRGSSKLFPRPTKMKLAVMLYILGISGSFLVVWNVITGIPDSVTVSVIITALAGAVALQYKQAQKDKESDKKYIQELIEAHQKSINELVETHHKHQQESSEKIREALEKTTTAVERLIAKLT